MGFGQGCDGTMLINLLVILHLLLMGLINVLSFHISIFFFSLCLYASPSVQRYILLSVGFDV